MNKLDIIEGYYNFHFIGIGGVNMSGLAEILYKEGYFVTGSDKNLSEAVERLKKVGVDVKIGHDAQNVSDDTQVVVYNAAISENNPEIVMAKSKNLRLMDRAELLGRLMQNYGTAICVAGSHGKTTVTSMLAMIFMSAQTDPTVMSGGILPAMGGAMRIGKRDVFIAEACEYHNSFLKLFPDIALVLNMEMDHSDYFSDVNALEHSFHGFAERVPADGMLVINGQIEGLQQIIKGLDCNICVFGEGGDIWAENISFNDLGCGSFDACDKSGKIGRISLAVPGEYNIQNAIAAIACALHFGIDFDMIARGLKDFTGANRRFQRMGYCNGAVVIDDYAHHPTEVAVTIRAAKNIPHDRLWAVFQSHTNTRTLEFLEEFADSLALADEIIVLDIFNPAGREEEGCPVHAGDLVDKIRSYKPNCRYLPGFDEAAEFLMENVKPDDMIIIMGAGSVGELARRITAKI